jgi:hypothetical protein
VEFALQDLDKPIGVSTYRLKANLPDTLQGSLPSAQQLQAEMDAAAADLEGDLGDQLEC